MPRRLPKRALIIAGPNGAGKTTFAEDHDPRDSGSGVIETTLSGRRYARLLPGWRAAGCSVGLVFLSLPSPAVAISRVASRVRLGDHDVPQEVIRRRFVSGRDDFERIDRPLIDDWWLYDNSQPVPRLLASERSS